MEASGRSRRSVSFSGHHGPVPVACQSSALLNPGCAVRCCASGPFLAVVSDVHPPPVAGGHSSLVSSSKDLSWWIILGVHKEPWGCPRRLSAT